MTLPDTLDELLRRARSGDERAFAELLSSTRARVFRWALVITRDSDDAEDVTQQVAIKLHRSLAQFEEKARFSTWLYSVVRNAALELTRKASRRYETGQLHEHVAGPLPDTTDDRLKQLDDQHAAALVRAFFTELPARQRELIELVDREGMSAAEAAAHMGIEPETARVHLLRARRALRTRMFEQHPGLFD